MISRFPLILLVRLVLACASMVVLVQAGQAAPSTLASVRDRGSLNCGVDAAAPGFSLLGANGQWSGLYVEFCKALAAAVFGNRDAVKFLSLSDSDRFSALRDGQVDVLVHTAPWTLSRDSELGVRFVSTLFLDGQGFLIPRSHAVASVMELSGASICVLPGSSGERAVSDFYAETRMRYQLVSSERWDNLVATYTAGGCTVLTGNVSILAAERSRLRSADDHIILPELITKEPLGPAVRTGDDEWFAIVRWVSAALTTAEELGVTASNAEAMTSSRNLDVRRFLGREADLGAPLGLASDWTMQVIRQVGNYGEIFERTLGTNSVLRLDRGLNNLSSKGGLMYAVPFR